MKKVLTKLILLPMAFSITLTSFNSISKKLNTNITYDKLTIDISEKQKISFIEEVVNTDGVNLISGGYYSSDGVYKVYINKEMLEKWKNKSFYYDTDDWFSLSEEIIKDIALFPSVNTDGKEIDYRAFADEFAEKFNQLIKTSNSKLYGIIAVLKYEKNYGNYSPAIYWRLNNVEPQFSLDSHNSSYIQENFILFSHNELNIFISREQWEQIAKANKQKSAIFSQIEEFPQVPSWNKDKISFEYLEIMTQNIINNFETIDRCFKDSTNHGWVVKTNTILEWLGCYPE